MSHTSDTAVYTHDGMVVHYTSDDDKVDDDDIVFDAELKEHEKKMAKRLKLDETKLKEDARSYARLLLSEEKDTVMRTRLMYVALGEICDMDTPVSIEETGIANFLQSVDSKDLVDATAGQLLAYEDPFALLVARLRSAGPSMFLGTAIRAAFCAYMISRPDTALVTYPHKDKALPDDGYWTLFHALKGSVFDRNVIRIIYEYTPSLSIKRPHALFAVLTGSDTRFASRTICGAPIMDDGSLPHDRVEAYMVAAMLSTWSPAIGFHRYAVPEKKTLEYIIGARVHPVSNQWLISISSPHCRNRDVAADGDIRCALWLCPACLGVDYDFVCQFHGSTGRAASRDAFVGHQLWCPYVGDMAMPRPLNGRGLMCPMFDVPDAELVKAMICSLAGSSYFSSYHPPQYILVNG